MSMVQYLVETAKANVEAKDVSRAIG